MRTTALARQAVDGVTSDFLADGDLDIASDLGADGDLGKASVFRADGDFDIASDLSPDTESLSDGDFSADWAEVADWGDSDGQWVARARITALALDAAPGWRWLGSLRVRRAAF